MYRIPKLAAGEVDIVAASMTHKQERDEEIDFSQTYFLDGQSLLVREDSEIKELKDLDGKTVTAIQGSTSIDNIQAKANELGITIDVVPLLEYPPAVEALKSGSVDVLTTDSVALSQLAKENPGLKVVGGRFTSEPYGIGVPNYDDRFRDLVNFTLQQMKVDGTYDRLYEKWFGEDEPYALEIWPGESYLNINTVPMLHIPAGEFIRGSNDGLANEAPQQNILLDEFYIDQYEVTNYLYAKCVMEDICNLPKIQRAVSSVEYFASPAFRNYPVIWVTWEDANNYCQFVGKRLPTEAEWEKAARGTDGRPYPWGEEEASAENKLTNFIGSGHIDTLPVGSHPAGVSPYGVHDMAGNVREWVADWSQRDYYQTAPTENPTGPESGVTRVVRGGAWNDVLSELHTSRRKDFLPDTFDGGLGFRCASDSFPPEG